MRHENPLIKGLKVKLAYLVKRTLMKQSKDLGDRQAGCHCADKRRPYRLAREQSGTALVEFVPLDHLSIRLCQRSVGRVPARFPKARRRTRSGQRVEAHPAEIIMAPSEACFHNEVEAHLVEYAAPFSVV